MSSNKWISNEEVIAFQTVILHPVENTLDVHRCVYVVFMFIHVCVCMLTAWGHQVPSSIVYSVSSLNLKLTDLLDKPKLRPWDPPVSALCPFPSPPNFRMTRTPVMPTFCMDTGDPNSGPHACIAGTWSTEPSPQPCKKHFQ